MFWGFIAESIGFIAFSCSNAADCWGVVEGMGISVPLGRREGLEATNDSGIDSMILEDGGHKLAGGLLSAVFSNGQER